MKPYIAIIGRPNVGKSTLFNRLSQKNKAIVIDEPGATRDRNYADCTWYEKGFTLIDTGGFEPASTEKMLVQMREQTHLAMEEADIIIFLMDGSEGLTPSDREITDILRGIEKPIFFVVNKIDGPKHENRVYEFYELGIDRLYGISAQHGQGIYELMDGVAEHLSHTSEDHPYREKRTRIAVIGKPNVGKSSLVNKILGYERAIVNPIPGTTRDAIDTPFEFDGKKYLLVDTAGIRRKSRVSHVLEKYSIIQALKAIDRCDIALLLIDAEEGMTEQDAKIAGLTVERGVGCIIVVNKWDAIKKDNATVGNYVRDIKDTIKFMDYAPIIFISAITGQRVTKIFDLIEAVLNQYTKRVSTAELNSVVRKLLDSNPPSRHQHRANTVSYITQASVAPPTFVFFVREPRAVHFSYRRFLANQIREAFGFDQTPIRIIFRKKKHP
ncbi:MAG TPA: ribosome biogenesis GTPase Der [Syntrophaceae bacterium]|jgi:GTP-binding protein|nr:ribosome biogenesis GTPase Der [Syntrophaceae bacterium]